MGATGAQGGGLVRAILNDKDSPFALRALTRDVNSDKARALADMGAEVVFADLDDQKSLENAFAGAYGAFCVTFFWAHFSPDQEKAGARAMASALKTAGVKHAIWSTLEDTRKFIPLTDNRMPTLLGEYKVPHFDAKEESNEFFIAAGVPTTFLYTSFYWENLIYFGAGPQKGPDGKLYLTMPMGDKRLPGIASEDIGNCAYGIFKQWPPRFQRPWERKCCTMQWIRMCTGVLDSRVPMKWATCSSSSATSTNITAVSATLTMPAS
jgi:uncharacterized protein YbjT (DUF2867 family)